MMNIPPDVVREVETFQEWFRGGLESWMKIGAL